MPIDRSRLIAVNSDIRSLSQRLGAYRISVENYYLARYGCIPGAPPPRGCPPGQGPSVGSEIEQPIAELIDLINQLEKYIQQLELVDRIGN
ncbi:hypothetical protein H6S82_27945 [Planktothrix sp. FACHB-1355]|uniref:Uncharacterized protein n=1 Tax=Aerosakkonema funiforme FACHB-1375 TaxID=2949571 RepID=A0A926VLX5_9CYAN|nr:MULTISPECIES: hypothetical protein [Oscillatoriales]MBD2186180.1 hypothetical protein [Aerosakkonema funiforme FACHB-1375]MBD3562648.1 hypothetical protein [Planktothrix sp. FACHB-1355]